MLEIYSEQVRDLLAKTNPKGGLSVRQNPKLGLFYVGDLKKVAVSSYEEIDRRIEEGTSNRTVASTQMVIFETPFSFSTKKNEFVRKNRIFRKKFILSGKSSFSEN